MSLLEDALAVLRREGHEPIAIGVPAVQGGLAEPDWVVALTTRPSTGEYAVVQADSEGFDEVFSAEDLLGAYAEFNMRLIVGEPERFDVGLRYRMRPARGHAEQGPASRAQGKDDG